MKTYYVEERATVIVQHLVNAKSKKEAIQLAKDWEAQKSEIIEYLDTDWMDITEVWIYNEKPTETKLEELKSRLKSYEKDYIWYVMERNWDCEFPKIKTKAEAIELLYGIDTEWAYENTVWESWHLAWLSEAIRILSDNK